MKKIAIFLALCLAGGTFPVHAAPVAAASKAVWEVVETAAKKSGRFLSPAAKQAARKALSECVAHYGDDALRVASHGGLEAIECMTRYGDDFIRLAAHSPQAARSLALHADDLMPLARRIGPDFMKLETKIPGLGKRAVDVFGEKAVPRLANMSAADAEKLIAYGAKAESPEVAQMLLSTAEKTGGSVLRHLDPTRIMAYGLSAAMITGAYKVSGGVAEAAKTSPGTVTAGIWGLVSLVAGVLILLYWSPVLVRKGWAALRRKPDPGV